jgi:hypothetical protein
VNSTIFERSYRNQVVDGDIISAFLETPSNEAIMKLIGHLSLTRNLNAPAEPTSAQRRKVQADPELVVARSLLNSSTKALRDRYGSVAAVRRKAREDPTVQIKLNENKKLKKDHDRLFRRKLTSLFEALRKEYFSTIRTACLENQHTG